MFKLVQLLDDNALRALREIAARGTFVDGKISNPHSKVKNNLQLHDAAAYERSSKILLDAMVQNADFMEFSFPARIAPRCSRATRLACTMGCTPMPPLSRYPMASFAPT